MCDLSTKSMDEIVSSYITIRDQKAALKAKQAEEMKPYDEALYKLEREVADRLNTSGIDSARTSAGTAYLSSRVSVKVADKSAFMDYVKANDAFDMLDVKANATAVKSFMEETQETPPGVNVTTEQTVGFRGS